jgi:hypothetical protein
MHENKNIEEGLREESEVNKEDHIPILEPSIEHPPTTPNIQPPLDMEVHHHGHVHEKKKWKEYVFQFFMLFLAVFCGFLAEYQLEHKIEKERGREYVISFREDLCKDTAILRLNIENLKKISNAGDSLVKILQENRIQLPEDLRKLYDYNLTSLSGFSSANLTDRTSVQLKNSGGMRLITEKKIIEAIIDYWAGLERLAKIELTAQEMRLHAREKSYLIFDQKYYADSSINGKRMISDQAQLMTTDKLVLTEFGNRVGHLKNLFKASNTIYLNNQKAKADTLIKIINAEYHLK